MFKIKCENVKMNRRSMHSLCLQYQFFTFSQQRKIFNGTDRIKLTFRIRLFDIKQTENRTNLMIGDGKHFDALFWFYFWCVCEEFFVLRPIKSQIFEKMLKNVTGDT